MAAGRGLIGRDRSGNIAETKDRYRDDTTVRDRYGRGKEILSAMKREIDKLMQFDLKVSDY